MPCAIADKLVPAALPSAANRQLSEIKAISAAKVRHSSQSKDPDGLPLLPADRTGYAKFEHFLCALSWQSVTDPIAH